MSALLTSLPCMEKATTVVTVTSCWCHCAEVSSNCTYSTGVLSRVFKEHLHRRQSRSSLDPRDKGLKVNGNANVTTLRAERRCANADFARVFSWLAAAKYAVRVAGDACAPARPRGGLHPLGNLIHISSAGSACFDEVSGCAEHVHRVQGLEAANSATSFALAPPALHPPTNSARVRARRACLLQLYTLLGTWPGRMPPRPYSNPAATFLQPSWQQYAWCAAIPIGVAQGSLWRKMPVVSYLHLCAG